ncbi:NAD-dependent epimerase/dehydratase family protein [Polynucleobacter sp. MWH-Braz-FAM2G]|uniref:NAD-dependent epimerase/dehydratase family protein n=1 Tax=Polynucleobacter sp. MWH-Braz-FAM2G TaxID=1855883 RepID=UPI001BFD509C|nr:NAD-dependent epimerase/dehydratase family protein [Polynucleobacter sp. MWH-Braz-FAM2G]QWD91110.1 NAD-dependent epimerase/dehydratase family protein [Polynucleobacter sp. MWH-Braz-FAM2G]
MAFIWVIGKGGLLGGALCQEFISSSDTLFDPQIQLSWHNKERACEEFKNAVCEFVSQVQGRHWQIYWAAGIGTMHSTAEELADETYILKSFIDTLLTNEGINLKVGTFVFASSAGAIYAGKHDEPIHESTLPSPINAYGHSKLQQESIANALNQHGEGSTVISCRITTLYGFKQKNGKQQGLLAEMVRRAISNEVIHIYVPLETMRDYISARVAAQKIIYTVNHLEKTSGIHIKIIASEVSTSIAQMLAIFKRIYKRNLRIVTQADIKSTQYQRAVQFRSEVVIPNPIASQSNLAEGIAELLRVIQQENAKGRSSQR